MHISNYRIFYFINEFNKENLLKLPKNVSVIYRNYKKNYSKDDIQMIKAFCKKNRLKFYLANNIDMALKLNLDGAYIPSFDKSLKNKKLNTNSTFELIGSAHNFKELFQKRKQNIKTIFLSPIFKDTKTNKKLGLNRYRSFIKFSDLKYVVLGGVKKENLKKLNILNCIGFASISYIKNLTT